MTSADDIATKWGLGDDPGGRGGGGFSDPMPGEPHSELGYAHRLIHVYGDRLHYVSTWKRWLVWDGQRWAPDIGGQVQRWMKTIARHLTVEARNIADEKARKAAVSAARSHESRNFVSGALWLASTEAGIVVHHDQLDAGPYLLNCPNGTLDLRTDELRPHDPADLITKVTGADYLPDADGPEFRKFFKRVQPREVMRAYLARLLGSSLVGKVIEHILPIFLGPGANGKSTLLNAVLPALGDYADAADPEVLMVRAFEAHPTSSADLFGLRLAVLHETDQGRRLAEGTVKRLSGGDRIKARRMREDFWHFMPSHTFVVLTNHRPLVGGQDEGIWSRLRLIPWDVIIPPAERDEQLPDKLAGELSAILAWLVKGYGQWRAIGLDDPKAVRDATGEYRNDSDALARFIEECCVVKPDCQVVSSALYNAWSKWCRNAGEEPGSSVIFARLMEDKEFGKDKIRGRMTWFGIGLKTTDDSEPGEQWLQK